MDSFVLPHKRGTYYVGYDWPLPHNEHVPQEYDGFYVPHSHPHIRVPIVICTAKLRRGGVVSSIIDCPWCGDEVSFGLSWLRERDSLSHPDCRGASAPLVVVIETPTQQQVLKQGLPEVWTMGGMQLNVEYVGFDAA